MAAAVGLGQTHVCSRHGSMRTPTPYSGPWFGRGMNKTKVDLRVERLVDDAKHVHSRDGARILGCLALRVVEVRGNRHHGIVELGAEVGLRCLLHLQEHHGGDLLRVELLLLWTSRRNLTELLLLWTLRRWSGDLQMLRSTTCHSPTGIQKRCAKNTSR